MLRRLKETIIRAFAFCIPAIFLAGVYAVLVRTYYLDSDVHRKLLLANAPVQSHFEHLRRKWGFHPERTIASEPGESIRAKRPSGDAARVRDAREREEDANRTALSKDAIWVDAPRHHWQANLESAKSGCEALIRYEFIDARKPLLTEKEITKAQRQKLIAIFERAKQVLLGWVQSHETQLGSQAFVVLRDRVTATGMKMPPVDFEPDLEFRVLLAYTRDPAGDLTIGVGSRFLRVLEADPVRAQFEMTRAMAQAWAPCDIAPFLEGNHPFHEWLSCFGVSDSVSCAPGVFAESGWAVSTALAAELSYAGCGVPAFDAKGATQCLAKAKLSLETSGQWVKESLWKVGQ